MIEKTYISVHAADEVTEEILEMALEIVDGWYQGRAIDWDDVWARLDGSELADCSELLLSEDLTAPALRKIKRYVNNARKDDWG